MDNEQPIESRDIQRTVIINSDGVPILTGGSDERAVVTADGGHTFIKTDLRVATKDGHILNPLAGDVALTCASCRSGPWSKHVMSVCMTCRCLVCAACTVPAPTGNYCAPCHRLLQRKQFWQWLLSFL